MLKRKNRHWRGVHHSLLELPSAATWGPGGVWLRGAGEVRCLQRGVVFVLPHSRLSARSPHLPSGTKFPLAENELGVPLAGLATTVTLGERHLKPVCCISFSRLAFFFLL